MDYEKKYENALAWARKVMDGKIGFVFDDVKDVFSELTESEDEKIRKAIEEAVNYYWSDDTQARTDILAWLEKQKPADKPEPKFRINEGKWYICISQFCNCIEGRIYKASADSRIIDDYGTEYDMHSDAYKYFRLWTIQDAKDGDVLVTTHANGHGIIIFIFKRISNDEMTCYCLYDSQMSDKLCFDACADSDYIGNVSGAEEEFIPATQEQRDLLFQKMREAGYKWDAEKKELKKIEQSTTNVQPKFKVGDFVEDTNFKGSPIYEIMRIDSKCYICEYRGKENVGDRAIMHYAIDNPYLRLLQKPAEWSEEDETGWTNTMIMIKECAANHYTKDSIALVVNWLNSLKDRVNLIMKYEDYEIKNNHFEYLGEKYDCSFAIKKDIKMIIREAESSHGDTFDQLYDRNSLKAKKVRLFLDENNNIVYGMIIYTIDYLHNNVTRLACGNYYPIWENMLMPHLFQASICW